MSFIGVDKYSANTLTSQLEQNMISFLDDGLLKIGAFGNVHESVSNLYGNNMSELKPVNDPHTNDGQLWQSARKNWVYENISGVDYSPVVFSGVTVNSVFYPGPTGNSSLGYSVNYKQGGITFDQSLATSSTVTASYSYKLFDIEIANNSNVWKKIQQESFSDTDFNNTYTSGEFAIPSEHRTQLPAIVIESVNRSNNEPWRLGDLSLLSKQKVLLHVFAENKQDRDKINDIMNRQTSRNIDLYDINTVVSSGIYPLNFDGSVNSNRLEYDEILANSHYKLMTNRFYDITVSEMQFYGLNLYGSTIEVTNELILSPNS